MRSAPPGPGSVVDQGPFDEVLLAAYGGDLDVNPLPDPFPLASRPPHSRDATAPASASVSPIGGHALAALNPGRRAVLALGAVGAIVALIAAYLAWHAQPRTVDVGAPSAGAAVMSRATGVGGLPGPGSGLAASGTADGSGGGAGGGAGGGPPGATGVGGSSPVAIMVVAVTGRVRHPGLVRLPPGARVADAIVAAGGALPGTDLSFVNVAAKVVDGELIVIGVTPPAGTTLGPTGNPAGGTAEAPGIVDINTATVTDLDTLPGIGPALAQRIVDYRTQHGAFHRTDELRSVPGIGDAKFAEIKDLVTV